MSLACACLLIASPSVLCQEGPPVSLALHVSGAYDQGKVAAVLTIAVKASACSLGHCTVDVMKLLIIFLLLSVQMQLHPSWC